MSTQVWGNTDAGPSRGRNAGLIVNKTVTTTPADVQYILSCAEVENFSIQFVFGAKVTCTDVKVYTSNSFVPCSGGSTGGDPQDETQAYRAGNWVDTGSRWTTGFTAPTGGGANNQEICAQGKPVDALFIRIVMHGAAATATTDTMQWYISGKSYAK